MTKDEELEQLQIDNGFVHEALLRKEDELEQSTQANRDLRQGLKQALIAIGWQRERVKVPEELIDALCDTDELHQLAFPILDNNGTCP